VTCPHKIAAVRAAIAAAGAQLFLLPPYSPDMNPIEMVFAKLKTLLRQVPERTRDGLWRTASLRAGRANLPGAQSGCLERDRPRRRRNHHIQQAVAMSVSRPNKAWNRQWMKGSRAVLAAADRWLSAAHAITVADESIIRTTGTHRMR
jgi:hypothetical protein